MTKLEIERSRAEALERLEVIADLPAEQRSEAIVTEEKGLHVSLRDLGAQFITATHLEERAAGEQVIEHGAEDGEARELRQIRGRVLFADYLVAALEQRAAVGAAQEYNQALNIAGNQFPLEILAGIEDIETRATTTAESAVRPQTWVDRVFADAAARAVGVTFRSVAPGVASVPVTTSPATVTGAQRAKAEATADSAWTVAVTELKPKANSIRGVFTKEDAARIPGLEAALLRDFRMALMEAIDKSIFTGDAGASGTAADITGLLGTTGIVEETLTQANKVSGVQTLAAFAALIDGKHAASPADLNVVAAVGANVLWMSQVGASGNSADATIAEFLRRAGINWRVRGDIEDGTAADDFGAVIGRARGIAGSAVAAIWSNASLVRDENTSSAKREVALTLDYLWDFAVPRAASFARLKFVT